jgi:anti-sigma regulatory factor (Ser/Thr protein kinase)
MNNSNGNVEQTGHPCEHFLRIVYEAPSRRKAIMSLSESAAFTVEKMGVETDFNRLKLVLMEVLTNALLYGNLDIPSSLRDSQGEDAFWELVKQREEDEAFSSKKIILELECASYEIRCSVKDQGEGFNWREYLRSKDANDMEGYHERGILLILSCVDSLSWNEKGNEIRFTIELNE